MTTEIIQVTDDVLVEIDTSEGWFAVKDSDSFGYSEAGVVVFNNEDLLRLTSALYRAALQLRKSRKEVTDND